MYLLGKIKVTAVLPEKVRRLRDIAYNLWWSWNSDATGLFREIDIALWESVGRNPVRFLQEVSQKKLETKLNDPDYMQKYDNVVKKFDSYMTNTDTWFNRNFPDSKEQVIAYFSAEYGLTEVLPIYSGGLGVLSGDHCKSASDLGIPLTAVGLFYKQGYFDQHINHDGWQETSFQDLHVSQLPVTPVLNSNGEPIYINVELPGRVVFAKIWEIKIGRISLYAIDTDVEQNSPYDRSLTSRLYGGDQETRIQQEIFLGIGGYRVLEALGIKPAVYHMNEGHSAFLGLEIMRKLVQERNLPFKAAKETASSMLVFTTHTPVPAGNDVFPLEMIDRYFSNFWSMLGISRHEFLDMGLKVNDNQNFNMTVLAMTLSGRKNGVSELHGAVTRNIFGNLWPGIPEDEVPVTHITNGIHTLTWLSPSIQILYNKYLSEDWINEQFSADIWQEVSKIPDEELWKTHCALKTKMIGYVRDRIREQCASNGSSSENLKEVDSLLDPDALTIGFARRFATYKRANLIFRNIERAKRIFNNPNMPVQVIFAGKAHPADRPAHEVIKNIHDIARSEGFTGKVILIENYNIALARNLVRGVDVWMNNPRRPLEASGTSGMKVCINGVINFSILDGWWCEGYNGKNGWAIGDDVFYDNEYFQDNADSESLYDLLENQIIPLFFDRDSKGIPIKWVNMMKESIKSLTYQFSTHRMLQDYTRFMYIPSMSRFNKIADENFRAAHDLADWKSHIEGGWSHVRVFSEKTMNELKEHKSLSGQSITLSTFANLGGIDPSNVKVEVYYGVVGKNNLIENAKTKEMDLVEKIDNDTYRYSADIKLEDGGEYGYTFRAFPYHQDIINKFDMGLIRWVVQ
jgi:starch phosphorylase